MGAMAAHGRFGAGLDARRTAILLVSIALHGGVLTALAIQAAKTTNRPIGTQLPPAIYLEIEPWPSQLAPRRPRPRAADGPAAVIPRLRRTPPNGSTPNPVKAVALPVPGSSAAPASDGSPSITNAPRSPAIGQSLRNGALGCRMMRGGLTLEQQALCDQRLTQGARAIGTRAVTAAEARREGAFAQAGAQALAQYESRRAPMRSGVGTVGAAPECIGGNLRGTCAGVHLDPEYQHAENAPFGGRAGPK